jgi:SWI/SNF-related matrix-associated actin-dependent regulator of chromatin subfamily D
MSQRNRAASMISRADLEQTFRKPGPMVVNQQAQPTQQQLQLQQAQEAARRELMKRQSKKPTDKNIPDGVDEICIGDAVQRYRELREIERTMDATMMRKKLDIQDSVNRAQAPRYGTLRIWISNTAENQPWQNTSMDPEAFDFESETTATYRVKVQGRLLDEDGDLGLEPEDGDDTKGTNPDAMEEDEEDAAKKTTPSKRAKMFSHFFKSIVIDFDRPKSLQPDGFTQIEWKRPEGANNHPNAPPNTSPEANFSQLEFERKGDENINITINLQRYENPERYRLSKPLAELLDTDEEDRAGVMMGVWEYVKSQGLQEDDDNRKIICDDRLKEVCIIVQIYICQANPFQIFNSETLYFPYLPNAIASHLLALPPLQIPYTIRVDKDYISPSPDSGIQPSRPTVFDVQVALEDPLRPMMLTMFRTKEYKDTLETISGLDDNLALIVQAISHSKAKHAFHTSMSKDPVNFVKRWISSQRRDLEVILGEATRGGGEDGVGEEWNRGGKEGVWGSELARESVALWLARQKH